MTEQTKELKRLVLGIAVSFMVVLTGCATTLTQAIENDDTKTVNTLLDHGSNPNMPDKYKYGYTPLELAAIYGHADVEKILLEHGADVNRRSQNGNTPLIAAANSGHADVAKVLLIHGANPNITNSIGDTPILLAAGGGYLEITKLLLAHGADVNHADNSGNTPLSMATAQGYKRVVKLLLAHGADVNHVDKYGNTPLSMAMQNGNTEIVGLLHDHTSVRRAKLEESEGHYRKAFQDYLSALKAFPTTLTLSANTGNSYYTDILKRAIRVSRRLRKFPPLPKEYRREMVVGLANVKDAKTKEDYKRALDHFLKASRIAPWVPQPYEASGHIFETLGNYESAAQYFALYLLVDPHAPNAQAIQDHIYVLEDKAKKR